MNEKLERAWAYLVARLQEPTTWRGLVLMLTAFGTQLAPEKQEAIIAVGLLIAGVIGAAVPDRGKP